MNTAVNPKAVLDQYSVDKIVRKNMVLLLLGQLVSLVGSSIYSFAMSLYILQLTGSGLNFSMNLAISTLPRVLFGPISGVIADRFNRKKMVVTLDIVSGLIMLGLLMLGLLGELKLVYIYVTTFLLSTASTFFNTPLTASIPNLVDEKNLTKVNSLSQAVQSMASIVGPFIGGIVFALVNIKLFLLVNGLSFIFSGISESYIDFTAKDKINGTQNVSTTEKKLAKKDFIQDLQEGFRYIISQRWLVILGSFIVFFNMFIMIGLTVPIPYIARQIWGFNPKQFGTLNMMFPIGMLAGSLILAKLPQAKSQYKRLMICILTFSVVILLAGIVTSGYLLELNNIQKLIIMSVLFVTMAIASVFINVPVGVTMQKLVPNDKLGRVYGALGTLAMGLSPVGAIIAGSLVDVMDPWMLPTICGITMIILTAFMSTVKEIKTI